MERAEGNIQACRDGRRNRHTHEERDMERGREKEVSQAWTHVSRNLSINEKGPEIQVFLNSPNRNVRRRARYSRANVHQAKVTALTGTALSISSTASCGTGKENETATQQSRDQLNPSYCGKNDPILISSVFSEKHGCSSKAG